MFPEPKKIKISIIVAMAKNGIIGNNNGLPWKLSADLKYFKATTMGKPLIMGRKTHDSIGKALPGRVNIVITRNKSLHIEGCEVAHSIDEAIKLATTACAANQTDEAFIIGGAQLYQQAINVADKLYLTQVQANIDGDTSFPEFDKTQWRLLKQTDHSADDANQYDYSFMLFHKLITK